MKTKWLKSLSLFLVCATALSGCKQESLETTVDRFYSAQQTKDSDRWDSIVSPSLRNKASAAFLMQEINRESEFQIVEWKILRVENQPQVVDSKGRKVISAKVFMDVTVRYRDKSGLDKLKDQNDYWICQHGKWYWNWTNCPVD